jgi:hypothetical protein
MIFSGVVFQMASKQIITNVTYSDESADFLTIQLIHYSEKSIALAVVFMEGFTKSNLSKAQKKMMKELKAFMGKDEDDEDTDEVLGGSGNTGFTYADGSRFFGYVFPISRAHKAIDWVSTRTALLPTREELEAEEIPEDLEDDPDGYQEYLNEYSAQTKEDLYDYFDMTPKRNASKYQKKPNYSKKGPKFGKAGTLPSKSKGAKPTASKPTTPLPGIPSSRPAAKPTVKQALEILAEALIEEKKLEALLEKKTDYVSQVDAEPGFYIDNQIDYELEKDIGGEENGETKVSRFTFTLYSTKMEEKEEVLE